MIHNICYTCGEGGETMKLIKGDCLEGKYFEIDKERIGSEKI